MEYDPRKNRPIDLRSDTATNPSPAMRQAMAGAEVGEDGLHEDPTVTQLEERTAELLGKEAALFVPTGTMGNLVAVKVHTQPGEEMILEEHSHLYNAEMAGLSAVCGLLARPIPGDQDGMLCWGDLRARIRPRVYSRSQTRLICLENTHNLHGGTVLDNELVGDLCARAHELGLKTHLDGARLMNASVASGLSLAALSAGFDSLMIDFAKGLGAPAGAVVAGPAGWIESARSVRKLLGGAIHQPGILAAACLHGLKDFPVRLRDDHRKARRLAEALSKIHGVMVDPERVVTNIVIANLAENLNGAAACERLQERGILVHLLEDGRLRFVTHGSISDEELGFAIDCLREEIPRQYRDSKPPNV